jgi:hypothetical protein
MEYREIHLIKYDTSKQSIPYSTNKTALDNIKVSDGVHVIGMNGENFRYIRKYNGSDIHNLSTSIKLNDPIALDSIIEINGQAYLMIILVENDDGNGNVEKPEEETTNTGASSQGGGSFTWVFYVLGVIGVIGGGFLIMKLRKRVRAA